MSIPAADPFGMTADPETYMPRAATERALAALERGLLAGENPVVLTGPAGIGKTLLLRIAERRLAERVRCVYIAYAALSAAELCSWILGLLGESAPPNGDAESALLAVARGLAQAGTPLALLIDDASAIPPDTAERIQTLAAGSGGVLTIAAADMEDASAEPWIPRFGSHVERVCLETPMNAAETALYIRARLERGGASSDERGRLDPKVIDRIFRRSNGIPRAVQALASEFLRVGEAALPREALQALLTQEDTAELAARAAAGLRARDVLPVERATRPEVTPPSGPVARGPVRSAPEKESLSLLTPPLATPLPSQPRSEPPVPVRESSLAPSQAASISVTPPAESQTRERTSPPLPASRRTTVPRPVAKRAPTPEAPARGLYRQTIWITVIGLAGAIALVIPFLRSAPAVPSPAPVPDAGSPASAKSPPELTGAAPIGVTASEPSPPKQLDVPPASQPESERPASSGSVEPEPSTPSAPAPRVAEVAPVPVHINATPWATIEVDGVALGETPIAGALLVPGNHLFRARMPDGRVIEKTVQIGADTRYVTFK